jgi:hypothetical protein
VKFEDAPSTPVPPGDGGPGGDASELGRDVRVALTEIAFGAMAVVTMLATVMLVANQVSRTSGLGAVATDRMVTLLLQIVSVSGSVFLVLSLWESCRAGALRGLVRLRSDRHRDGEALLGEWRRFERMLAAELPQLDTASAPRNLAGRLERYAQLYDYDHRVLLDLLDVRNAVARGGQVSAARVAAALAELGRLTASIRLADDEPARPTP